MNSVDKVLAEKKAMTPKTGYNLVGVDDFGKPDEQGLFLVGNFKTKEDAEAEKTVREHDNPDQKYFIYGAE